MSRLRVEGVRKQRGKASVLQGLDLAVPPGAILALLGSSGCGKTTLLRLIAGFDRCDEGRIVLGDTLLDGPRGMLAPERRGIGYVPQEGLLFPHLTVAGNVGFGLRRAERRGGRVGEALRLVGLDGVPQIEARQPHQLSGGQQQRVALARALAPRPGLVLLDEPFNGLDQALRRRLAADVAAVLRSADATAILVTHDPVEAFASADSIAVLRDGRIAQQAAPSTIYRSPCDIHVARLTGPTVELEASVCDGIAETALGRVPVDGRPASGGSHRVVLRPEQVIVDPQGVPVTLEAAVFGGDHTAVTASAGSCRFECRVTGELPATLRVRVEGVGLVL